ncbi:hypothetical protein JZO73_12945 [Enterococcus plantarum]|uniref:hypothetical protein n=1 Tax=Enterococcus plantarum TaxID=1077675 RepID=UPI001A8D1B1C|nr:hypothetical protein [Enterococcus plantarum]MBO0468436.1 hypothetical protein [Enterococcus plantarum]
MDKLFTVVGASTLPEFPKVDLAPTIEWVQNGIVSLWTSNAGLIITAGIIMAAMPIVIKKVKGMGKSAMKG